MSQALPKKIEGKPIQFDILKIGKTLIKLSDGYYVELTSLPLKVIRQPTTDQEGNPQYVIASNNAMTVWTREQVSGTWFTRLELAIALNYADDQALFDSLKEEKSIEFSPNGDVRWMRTEDKP